MTILDANSNPVTSSTKLIHGSDQSRLRGPQFRVQNKSLEDLITERDRDVIISLSLKLFSNLGVVKSVVDQKKIYSVGQAWLPTYKGADKENGAVVEDWLIKSFYPSLDVRGNHWDWWENLESISSDVDVRGDHFTLLTTDKSGTMPRVKTIPAYSVKTKGTANGYGSSAKVTSGEYEGNKIVYGIIYDEDDMPLAYRVSTGNTADEYVDVPAASIIHSFDPGLSDGRRGLPVATHALDELKHILQSTEYESSRQLILSSIGLFVENDTGGPDTGDPRNQLTGSTTEPTDGVVAQEISPQIWYAQAGEGNKITQLKHETGGDSFDSYHDRLIRSFVAGAGWSYSLTWKPTGQGTAERGEILRARKAIASRQRRIDKWALRVITYAYAFENAKGNLPDLESPFAWEFTKPPRLSVDDGREEKMQNEAFRLGRRNMTDLLEFDGRTYDEHLDMRGNEALKRQLKIQQIFDETGIKIDERELVMFSPNDTADQSEGDGESVEPTIDDDGNEVDQPESPEQQQLRFAGMKAKFDAYGVGVRAGAITPIRSDEESFRLEANLPPMSTDSDRAWDEDEGFRRPITLLQKGDAPGGFGGGATNNQDDE